MKNNHYVPLYILDKYWKSFEIPFKEEGFDEIILHNKIERDFKNEEKIIYQMNVSQDNKHHTQNLIDHSIKVYKGIEDNLYFINTSTQEEVENLLTGVYLHDVGKLWTKFYKQDDPNAHYYNHENVGAYWKICNGWTIEEAFYENYHMLAHNWKTDKSKEKWKKVFGQEKFNILIFLQEVDKGEHV